MDKVRRAVQGGSVWVLWIIGSERGRGIFTPQVFTTLRALKTFVEGVEGCNVDWEHKNDPTHHGMILSVAADSSLADGARWLAARAQVNDQDGDAPRGDPFIPTSFALPPMIIGE